LISKPRNASKIGNSPCLVGNFSGSNVRFAIETIFLQALIYVNSVSPCILSETEREVGDEKTKSPTV